MITEPGTLPDDDPKEIAYHEAGHAVVSVELGRAVEYVTIEAGTQPGGLLLLGHIKNSDPLRRPPYDPFRDRARNEFWVNREILICYAGPAADERLTGSMNHDGAEGDYEEAFRWSSWLHHENRTMILPHIDYLLTRARRMIQAAPTWDSIVAVAEDLLERRRITGTRVRKLCRATSPGLGRQRYHRCLPYVMRTDE